MRSIHKISLVAFLILLISQGTRGLGSDGTGDTIADRPLLLDETSFQLQVALLENQSKVAVSSDRGLVIIDPGSGEAILSSRAYIPWWLEFEDGSLRVRTEGLHYGPVLVKPKGGGRLILSHRPPGANRVTSKWYRGTIEILPTNGGLLAINIVDVEDYLYGVLPAEAAPDWPKEALKAQAVASRTFALHRRLKRGSGLYDLDSSIASQVYVGAGSEDGRTNAAVDETTGLVITYEGAPIPAYYHANSGGHTEDIKDVWGGSSQPYLRSIDDPFSKDGSRYEWSARLSLDEIRRMLTASGIDLPGQIYRIDAAGVSPSNRVTQLLITYQGGAMALSGNAFRLALDPLYTVKSTMFTVRQVDGVVEFVGYGSGHGVGLSQESARAMAEKGFGFQLILGYFYPGTEISKVERAAEADSVSVPISR